MYLKELDLGSIVKCTCMECEGTGIYKGICEKDDLGVICDSCNGRGYYILESSEKTKLVQDEETGIVYKVSNGIISEYVTLFNELKKRDDVNYVMYGTGRLFSPKYLFKHGASEINVIRYSEFLEGKMPLPMVKYSCPRQISQNYGHEIFDNDCKIGYFSDCNKFGTKECWEKFYGEAKTTEEKQNVLKKI